MVKIDKGLLRFTVAVFALSLVCFSLLSLRDGQVQGPKGPWHEVGELLGTVGAYALAALYGRTLLKITLSPQNAPGWFTPIMAMETITAYGKRLLHFLNKTHYHVGIATIAVLFFHATLEGRGRLNPFFILTLVLLAWQGLFGLLILAKFLPPSLKRPSYPAHAQLFSGIMILIFALFGHLLVD